MNNTLVQKYAPALFSAVVALFGGLQVLISTGAGLVEILQFAVLAATTVTTYLVPLVDAKWQGAFKTGLEVAGVMVTAALPFAIEGSLSWPNALLIAVAMVKALATQFGVVIRTEATIDARGQDAGAAPVVVTTLPASSLPATDALVVGDGLSDPLNANLADVDDAKHRAG